MDQRILAMHCMSRSGESCKEDGKLCSMCAQWHCADNDIVNAIIGNIALKDVKDGARRRGVVEYYDLLMTSENLALTFSTREAEDRLLSAPANQQTNLTRFEF